MVLARQPDPAPDLTMDPTMNPALAAPLWPAAGPMHVLLIAPDIADYCIEYANALAAHAPGGTRITLLAPQRLFARHAQFVEAGVDLRLLDWPRHRSLRNVPFVLHLRRMIATLRPDVVHILAESILWLHLVLPTARRHGLVTTMHDVAYHPGDAASRRVPRWFADRLVRRSHRVVVHGAQLREEAERRYPALRGRVAVMAHVQLQRYLGLAQARGLRRRDDPTLNVLFFGRIYAYKGLDVLLQSVPLVTRHVDAIRFIIAGAGEDLSRYAPWMPDARFVEIRNRHIPDEETAQLFRDADIVVLPYREASQSGVLAIAQAFGTPVVVSDVGELGQSVQDGISGLVVPPGDVAALADAVVRLATDPDLRRRLGAAGRAAADRAAGRATIASTAFAIYRDLMAERRLGLPGGRTTPDDATGHAEHRGAGLDMVEHDGVGPNRGTIADRDPADDLRTRGDAHVVANRRSVGVVGVADDDVLVDPAIRPDALRRDQGRDAVLDEQAGTDVLGVDLQAGQRRAQPGERPRAQAGSKVEQIAELRRERHQGDEQADEVAPAGGLRQVMDSRPARQIRRERDVLSHQQQNDDVR